MEEGCNQLQIGVSSWIIQDGNYGDFTIGDECQFALEYGIVSENVSISLEQVRRCQLVIGSTYAVQAKVIHQVAGLSIIDCGFLAYSERPIRCDISVGDWIQADVYIGVDPFFYMEYLRRDFKDTPRLFYRWKILAIDLETTPWIEVAPRTRARDAVNISHLPVVRTNAWNDDGGNGEYVLHAEVLRGPY